MPKPKTLFAESQVFEILERNQSPRAKGTAKAIPLNKGSAQRKRVVDP
jgi:hypothetical protein